MDELLTVLLEVEATLNCGPLTYEYEERGGEMLIPSHLMYGRRIISMPCWPDNDDDEDWSEVDVGARFRYLSTKLKHFWNRWHREYLYDLLEHHDCKGNKSNARTVKVGEVVVVSEEGKKHSIANTSKFT